MKTKDLEVGKIYTCKLSKQEILVVKTQREVKAATEKDSAVTEDLIAGKLCVTRDNVPQFLHVELHDGQLEESTNQ